MKMLYTIGGRKYLHCSLEVGGFLLQPDVDALNVEQDHLALGVVVCHHGEEDGVDYHDATQLYRKQKPVHQGPVT